MKKVFFTIGLILYGFSLFANVEFISSFEKAKNLAAQQKKFIFVDVMADWCGPCKVMLKQINGDYEVVSLLNESFINLKVNEKDNASFLQKYSIKSFPTVMIMDQSGTVLESYSGFPGLNHLKSKLNYYKSLSTIDKTDPNNFISLTENEIVSEIANEIVNLPPILRSNRILEWAQSSQPISEIVLKNFGEHISYDNFCSFLSKKNLKGNYLGEKLINSFLKKEFKLVLDKSCFDECDFIEKLTGLEKKKCLAYMVSFHELKVLPYFNADSQEKSSVHAKALIRNYPETSDWDLLYSAFISIAINEKNVEYFESIEKSIAILAHESEHYAYDDFLSVIYYKQGNKTEATNSVLRATEKAQKLKHKFKSIISEYREEINKN